MISLAGQDGQGIPMQIPEGNDGPLEGFVGRELDGRYSLEQFIARGGFGAIYRGFDRKVNKPVAIKVGFSSREFTKEAQLAAEVQHDHAVQVSDYGSDNGLAYLVMEWLEGEDLEELFHRQEMTLSREQLLQLVHEIGGALSHAHARRLIHRDLKPRNIFSRRTDDSESKFVLLDFGIAAMMDAQGTRRNRTQDGAGTVTYMAPELLQKADATPASDIYAFGVLLYQMLTGRLPYPQPDSSHVAMQECIRAILHSPPPLFREVAPERAIPEAVEQLVIECLAKDPSHRPDTMAEVRSRFARALSNPPAAARDSGSRPPNLNETILPGVRENTPDDRAEHAGSPPFPGRQRSVLLAGRAMEVSDRATDTALPRDTSATSGPPSSRGGGPKHPAAGDPVDGDSHRSSADPLHSTPSGPVSRSRSSGVKIFAILSAICVIGILALVRPQSRGAQPKSLPEAPSIATAQISGTLDPADATLSVNGKAVAVHDGKWSWDVSGPGVVDLRAVRKGYEDWSLVLDEAASTSISIQLQPIPAAPAISLEGTLRPADAHLTINGAPVDTQDGRWKWSSQERDTVELAARRDGYADWRRSLTEESPAPISIELERIPAMRLSGTIDPPDARLTANGKDVQTRDGTWTWSAMELQPVELAASRDGFLEWQQVLKEGGATTVAVRLKPMPKMRLEGTLLPPDAKLTIDGIPVEVRDGQWEWSALSSQAVELAASRAGFVDWKQTHSKVGTTRLPIALEPIPVIPPASLAGSDLPDESLESATELAQRAYSILKDRCSRCHGQAARQAGLDVLSRDNLLQERGEPGGRFAFLVPGDQKSSRLLDAIGSDAGGYMPQEGSPEAAAMSLEERNLLRRWIGAGAQFPERERRVFLSDMQVLKSIRDHQLSASPDDRRYFRYYSLAHLQNNPGVTELDLRLYRAALAKVLNSLTRERNLHLPQALADTADSVYWMDLRKLGWHRSDVWTEVLQHYPYGLKYDSSKNEELRQLAKDVAQFSETDLPVVRADWFIVTASRPPLYHKLLDIPATLKELEQQLQLNVHQNFLDGQVARSGFAKSGVSKQNRLLERHTSAVANYFWISYDFLPRRARGDLTRFPLGPAFPSNPFRQQAFDHDGGEIIWSLPNGLQAYMLVNAQGDRIDQGPVEVVFDRSAVLGTPAILNGISCMSCHREGMIVEFRDEVRGADAVAGEPYQKVKEIHPLHDEMQKLVRADQEAFLKAHEQVIGPFLKIGDDAGKTTSQFPEPVGRVASIYSRDLTATEVALELGIDDFQVLRSKIATNRELLRMGLGALVQDPPATMKRERWETRDGTSLMQDVASALRMGVPYIP